MAEVLDDLATRAAEAADALRSGVEAAKRTGLQTLVDLGAAAQERLDEMPAEDEDAAGSGEGEGEAPPEATTLPS